MAKKGFILRSGGADGCDSAFEKGCDLVQGKKEIYLPWKGFNDNNSPLFKLSSEAQEIAFKYHPNLYGQKDSVVKLMTRNSYQVLGRNLVTKSLFILCYCLVDDKGVPIGGTSQALRIAEAHKIPIFNLYHKDDLQKFKDFMKIVDERLKTYEEKK